MKKLNTKKLSNKKVEQNKILVLNMINKIDAISNFCMDEFIIIKLAKFQQQLYKICAANEYYLSEIDYKINNIIDDILIFVAKYKNNEQMENRLHISLTNLIELMETRITLDHLDK